MTPHSPPFGHPDPYQPIQSPAAFTTIFSTLHKPMALRGRIPNIFIYTNTYKQTVIYLWWDNHSGYTFFLLNTRHNQLILILWTIIMENQDMLWRSRYHPTTMERINVLALMLIIRKFTYTLLTKNLLGPCNIFLYNLCQHMFFSLWDFPAIITLPPIPVLTSIAHPTNIGSFSLGSLFFPRHVPTFCLPIPSYTHKFYP